MNIAISEALDICLTSFVEAADHQPDGSPLALHRSLNAASETLPGPGAYHREEHHEKASSLLRAHG
eukprot:4670805-Pleurochrysis_carterae.AAC.1